MATVSELTPGDLVALHGLRGVVETVVHYRGEFDVRVALRCGGSLRWCGANYTDECKRVRSSVRRAAQ